MEARVEKNAQPFTARLIEFDGRKVEQFTFNNVVGAMAAKATLQKAANGELTVGTVDKKQRRRNPAPPFTTRSEEHTSELQSLMRISYAVFCLKKKNIVNYYTGTIIDIEIN